MRILFLHPNFPGQFKHVAAALARDGHDVVFLCQTHFGRTLPGVRRLCMKGNLGHGALQDKAGNQLQRAQTVATQFRRAMARLDQDQWHPDVVVSHSGWGCGLHVKELWPQCRHVSYLEWWFDPRSDLLHHDPGNQALGLGPQAAPKFWLRNQPLALELACADAVVAPSQWQRAQLPPLLRSACEVIFDGIDLSHFRPDPRRRSPFPLLTYGTRGMEPMRGFPELIRELPQVLEQWPELQVEIAGDDGIHYCGKPPGQGSWKTWAQQHLASYETSGRLRWVGHLPGQAYLAWLQSTWCHVYLTQPFVASWSLVEALACGCPLVASDVAPVREFCGPERAWLVDSRKPGFLAEPVRNALTGASSPKPPLKINTAFGQTSALERWKLVLGLEVAT